MYEWGLTVFKYIAHRSPEMKTLETSFLQPWEEAYSRLQEKYSARHFYGMKQGCNDMATWANNLSPSDIEELNEILLNKFGKGLIDANKEHKKLIKRIIKRGSIKSDEEFYLITEYLSDTTNEIDFDINKLNKLLGEYEYEMNANPE